MDQAKKLRDLVAGEEGRAKFLAVASGKGGVGKSSCAVNLAVSLVQLGKRVALVDLDIGLANVDVMLSVQPRYNLGHVLSGETSVRDTLVPTPFGVTLLSGCTGVRHISDLEQAERDFLVQGFQDLGRSFDVVIFDTAAGISKNVVQFAAISDEVLVITIPEPTAMTDAYAVIKAVAREKGRGRIRLIVNQCRDAREAGRVFERIRMVAQKFLSLEVDGLGFVPTDQRVSHAIRRRVPFVVGSPKSSAARKIRLIAEKIVSEQAPATGFIRKFATAVYGMKSQ